MASVLKTVLPRRATDRLSRSVNAYRAYRGLKMELSSLCAQYAACGSSDERIDLVRNHHVFGAIQQHREIADLLRLLEKNPPRYVCEIGASSGGTLLLLARVAHPDALLLSVDINLPWQRRAVHRGLATRQQRVVSICGDSRAPETIERVRSALHGRPLDFLFIDGDHAYDGVKADFPKLQHITAVVVVEC